MWTPPAVFQVAKGQLDECLKNLGFTAMPPVLSPGAFGSAYAEYQGAGRSVRLVWDGKESALWVEALEDGHWRDVEALVAGGLPRLSTKQGPSRAVELVDAVKVLMKERTGTR